MIKQIVIAFTIFLSASDLSWANDCVDKVRQASDVITLRTSRSDPNRFEIKNPHTRRIDFTCNKFLVGNSKKQFSANAHQMLAEITSAVFSMPVDTAAEAVKKCFEEARTKTDAEVRVGRVRLSCYDQDGSYQLMGQLR